MVFLLDGESNLLLSFAIGGVSKVRTGFHPKKMEVSVPSPKNKRDFRAFFINFDR